MSNDLALNDAPTASQAPAVIEKPSQLLTIKPEKYVADVFAPFKKDLTKAIKQHGDAAPDVTTKAGMELATAARAAFRSIRIDSEKERKERKAPIMEIGKLLDSRCKELHAEIEPYESKFDNAIKAEEARKEAEKQAKLAAERARVEAIENRIAAIRAVPVTMADASSAAVAEAIERHSTLVLDPADFEEYLEDAIAAVNATVLALQKLQSTALAREAEQKRLAAEREELARLREEAAQRERAAAEQRTREAEEQRRQQQAHEAELQAMREQLARQQQELDAQRAQAEAKALAEQLAEVRMQRDASALAQAIESYASSDEATAARQQSDLQRAAEKPSAAAPAVSIVPQPAVDTGARIRLGDINSRLGFTVTADFLAARGFPQVGREGAAKLFRAQDFGAICASIVQHVQGVAAEGLKEAA